MQSWDRLGWTGGPLNWWMQLRDRRGPFAALLLAVAYTLVLLAAVDMLLVAAGWATPRTLSPIVQLLLLLNTIALLWRAGLRAIFTARDHGISQGLVAVPRIVVSNAIAILAGVRALAAYLAALRGAPFAWDKTDHDDHPASALLPGAPL